MSHAAWLATLRTGDDVKVRNGGLVFSSQITDDTPRFLFIGKLKYHRSTGWMTAAQYRLDDGRAAAARVQIEVAAGAQQG